MTENGKGRKPSVTSYHVVALRRTVPYLAALVWVLLVELAIFHDHFSWEGKWQYAEQLNASATEAPLVILFLLMLLEISACYGSLKGISRVVCWVAGAVGMFAIAPFLFKETLPVWWLALITLPMISVKLTVFLDQCSVFGEQSSQVG